MKQRTPLFGISERLLECQSLAPTTIIPSSLEVGTDVFNETYRRLSEEFSFQYSDQEEMNDSDIEKFDSLFSWLVEQLRTFPSGATNPKQHLKQMLAVAAFLESDDQLWDELAKATPNVPELLIDNLALIIDEHRADGPKILASAHLEAHQIHSILTDIASKDWQSLAWATDQLETYIWSPIKQHAWAALYRFDHPRLKSTLEAESEFFEIFSYILHAPVTQSLHLAPSSKNWTLKFWALYNSVRAAARGADHYPAEWELLLSEAAKIPEEWVRWLAILNSYPGRYPQLQEPLGNTLASASDEALDAYVLSITIDSDFGRIPIATALTAFRKNASTQSRQRLWTSAFKKWEQWDFGCTRDSGSLFRVATSSFDFPVVGYFIECLDSEARTEKIRELQARAAANERNWHPDITPAITERYKLISIYQPLTHSGVVGADEPGWLWDPTALYRPAWEDGSLYRSLKYDELLIGGQTKFASG